MDLALAWSHGLFLRAEQVMTLGTVKWFDAQRG